MHRYNGSIGLREMDSENSYRDNDIQYEDEDDLGGGTARMVQNQPHDEVRGHGEALLS